MVRLVSASPTTKESLQRQDSVREELEPRFDDAYDENGVDRALIRWRLFERLRNVSWQWRKPSTPWQP